MTRDLTDVLERFEAIERHVGVRFEALYAALEDDALTVAGEIYPLQGDELPNDVSIVAAAYDVRGLVVGRAAGEVDSSTFFAFEPFSLRLDYLPTTQLTRIVLYASGGA